MKIYFIIIAVFLIALTFLGYRYSKDISLEMRLKEYGCRISYKNKAWDRFFLGKRPSINVIVDDEEACIASLKTNDFMDALKNCDVECVYISSEEENWKTLSILEEALLEKSFFVVPLNS